MSRFRPGQLHHSIRNPVTFVVPTNVNRYAITYSVVCSCEELALFGRDCFQFTCKPMIKKRIMSSLKVCMFYQIKGSTPTAVRVKQEICSSNLGSCPFPFRWVISWGKRKFQPYLTHLIVRKEY